MKDGIEARLTTLFVENYRTVLGYPALNPFNAESHYSNECFKAQRSYNAKQQSIVETYGDISGLHSALKDQNVLTREVYDTYHLVILRFASVQSGISLFSPDLVDSQYCSLQDGFYSFSLLQNKVPPFVGARYCTVSDSNDNIESIRFFWRKDPQFAGEDMLFVQTILASTLISSVRTLAEPYSEPSRELFIPPLSKEQYQTQIDSFNATYRNVLPVSVLSTNCSNFFQNQVAVVLPENPADLSTLFKGYASECHIYLDCSLHSLSYALSSEPDSSRNSDFLTFYLKRHLMGSEKRFDLRTDASEPTVLLPHTAPNLAIPLLAAYIRSKTA